MPITPIPMCVISGTLYSFIGGIPAQGSPAKGVGVHVKKVIRTGITFHLHDTKVATSSLVDATVSFSLPQGSQVWIEGSFYVGNTNCSRKGGAKFDIPEDDTANLEDLGGAASGPTTGLTVKVDDVAHSGLYNILNFVSPGIIATPGAVGTLNISVPGELDVLTFVTRETPTPAPNGIETVFTLADTPVLGSEEVFLNGILQEEGDDYTIDEDEITFAFAPDTEFKIRVSYRV